MRSLRMALLLAAALLPLGSATATAAPATDLLPDLQMAPIYGVELQAKHGQLRLRFGTLVNNVGDGPIIVRGSGPVNDKMTRVVQRVKRDGGRARTIEAPDARMYFEHLGVHGHWHLRDFVTMRLIALSGAVPDLVSTKIGFCFYDTTRLPLSERPPNSTEKTFSGCGEETSRRVRMGISVGWGDAYEPSYQFQAIDVTALPRGTYLLCSAVNPHGLWLEKSATNNSSWVELEIRPGQQKVTVVRSGASAC